jgi:hypothetical protein
VTALQSVKKECHGPPQQTVDAPPPLESPKQASLCRLVELGMVRDCNDQFVSGASECIGRGDVGARVNVNLVLDQFVAEIC